MGGGRVKWVEEIRVQGEPAANFFQASYQLLPAEADPSRAGPGDGFSLGPLAVNAAILAPDEAATVPAGPVTVAGYALAGDYRRVARVDISADGGHSWRQASLEQELSPWSWRRPPPPLDLPPRHADATPPALG